ncbi:MAG: hypothetical protein HC876_16225 [Chloroflexaceae bacterium]|nr:hypothetical protein [Chloroflexaceae bacterium]
MATPPAANPEPPQREADDRPRGRTLIVDPWYREGEFGTISEAIAAANPGDRIMVKPGTYEEALVIAKPGLEIIGDGGREHVIVEATQGHVISFRTTIGRVVGLTIRQLNTVNQAHCCIDIGQGRLEVEDCDIINGATGIRVADGAKPQILYNIIHSCYQGIEVSSEGRGIFEGNKLYNNKQRNWAIDPQALPFVTRINNEPNE